MNKTRRSIVYLTQGAVIAAVYAVLTVAMWQFSSLQIQVRISEAFCVLPLFTNAAVPGLFIGCFVANLIAGNVPDMIFGSLTTLCAALITYFLGRKLKGKLRIGFAPLPAVLLNAIVVPYILYYGYGFQDFLGYTEFLPVIALNTLSVFIGQGIACYGIGVPLTIALDRITQKVDIFGRKKYNKRNVKEEKTDVKVQ